MAEQQVQLTDLDPVQLQEVKKQLDQVSRRRRGQRQRQRVRGVARANGVSGDLVALS